MVKVIFCLIRTSKPGIYGHLASVIIVLINQALSYNLYRHFPSLIGKFHPQHHHQHPLYNALLHSLRFVIGDNSITCINQALSCNLYRHFPSLIGKKSLIGKERLMDFNGNLLTHCGKTYLKPIQNDACYTTRGSSI